MYAIPRGQLVRATLGRSLMRRALAGIVPAEILDRTKTTPAPRQRTNDAVAQSASRFATGQALVSGFIGIMAVDRFVEAVYKARRKEPVPLGSLQRSLVLEAWLRHLMLYGVLAGVTAITDFASAENVMHQSAETLRRGAEVCTRKKDNRTEREGTAI
jgi:hypothetical protein